ncbi:MAG TPA: hypothetical protein PKC87_05245 [Candidatus Absconditabacterales bacterium]|nr:hypothetical protein [Candidatus Absconditabacterales bacterium]
MRTTNVFTKIHVLIPQDSKDRRLYWTGIKKCEIQFPGGQVIKECFLNCSSTATFVEIKLHGIFLPSFNIENETNVLVQNQLQFRLVESD